MTEEEQAFEEKILRATKALETAVDALLAIRDTPGAGTWARSVADATTRHIGRIIEPEASDAD